MLAAMPGIHFDVVITQDEIDAMAEQAVHATARQLAERAFPPRSSIDMPEEEVRALAELHALLHLQRAAQRLSEKAAHTAARFGAGYPDLAAALAMTRQGARKRYPHLVERHAPAYHDEES